MACTSVPQIVLHISYSTCTYWGHFRPSKVSFSAVLITTWRVCLCCYASTYMDPFFRILLLSYFFQMFCLEMCPRHQYSAALRQKKIYNFLADLIWPWIVKNIKWPRHKQIITKIWQTISPLDQININIFCITTCNKQTKSCGYFNFTPSIEELLALEKMCHTLHLCEVYGCKFWITSIWNSLRTFCGKLLKQNDLDQFL